MTSTVLLALAVLVCLALVVAGTSRRKKPGGQPRSPDPGQPESPADSTEGLKKKYSEAEAIREAVREFVKEEPESAAKILKSWIKKK